MISFVEQTMSSISTGGAFAHWYACSGVTRQPRGCPRELCCSRSIVSKSRLQAHWRSDPAWPRVVFCTTGRSIFRTRCSNMDCRSHLDSSMKEPRDLDFVHSLLSTLYVPPWQRTNFVLAAATDFIKNTLESTVST